MNQLNKSQESEKLFIYYRVSTELQDTKMQKYSVKKFLEDKKIIIVEEFEDKAMSGILGFERPAFKEMNNRLDEVDGIILYDWDRISREEEFAVTLMYALRNKNKFVYESSTGQKLDFNQLYSRIQTFLKSVMASEERLRIKKRQKGGIAGFIEEYGRWGPFPYYGKNTSGKKLTRESFWQLYEQYRIALIGKSAIARVLQMSRTNLYNKLKKDMKRYKEIEERLKESRK